MSLGAAQMAFRYQDSFCLCNGLKGYERLILDAMLGDQALFTRADGVERLWEISAPLLNNPPPVQPYTPASWGPEPALRRLAAPFRWHLSSTGPPP
jgi:glucose-6-phosphate 1-dehydrogenase